MTTTTADTVRSALPSRAGDPAAEGVRSLPSPRPAVPSVPAPSSSPRRRRPTDGSAARALAMLTRRPVFAAALPQLHLGGRAADGSIVVDDRAAERRVRVYTPRLNLQFRAGYRAGLWYVRTLGDVESSPRSPGYPTRTAALDSLRSAPRGRTIPSTRGGSPCRVIWS